jgi:hypothetical protein
VAKVAPRVAVAVVVVVAVAVASPHTPMAQQRPAQSQPKVTTAKKTVMKTVRSRRAVRRSVAVVVAAGDQKAPKVPPMIRPAPSLRSANRVTLSTDLRAQPVSKPSVSVVVKAANMVVVAHRS